ncbi:MAG: CocE/NonD family hydrolase [Muricauda sp. TMED12]|nr:MAG: CocE/NonD family hydrolase [Muricauda sp. TMED12]
MKRIMLSWCALAYFLCTSAQEKREYRVKVADSISLATDLYIPDGRTSGPVVLIRTSYGKEGLAKVATAFAKEGFFTVVQDVRGKYASDGKFVPFLNEIRDGTATLEWLHGQHWNNGNVGLWGSSYLGYCALSLAMVPKQVKSIFHLSGWLDGESVNLPGGALHQQLVIPWLIFEGQKTKMDISKMDMDQLFVHTPLEDVFPTMNFETDSGEVLHLSQIDISPDVFEHEQSNAAIFHCSGWFDFVLPAVLSTYQDFVQKAKGAQFLKIGPWYHNQLYDGNTHAGMYRLPNNAYGNLDSLISMSINWFNQTLNGTLDDKSKPVSYYVLFEDKWKAADQWPPRSSKKETLYIGRDFIPEGINGGASYFAYDPNNPVPTVGGANFQFFLDQIGVREQNMLESRDDVLVFTTLPFDNPKTIAGPIEVILSHESLGTSTDLTAKLTIVDSAGGSWNITDGIKRIDSIDRGIQETSIQLPDVAFQVKPGQCLRIQISGGSFPKYNRNPGTGEDPLKAMDFKPVKHTIFHSEKHPSYVTIYVEENID